MDDITESAVASKDLNSQLLVLVAWLSCVGWGYVLVVVVSHSGFSVFTQQNGGSIVVVAMVYAWFSHGRFGLSLKNALWKEVVSYGSILRLRRR